MLEIRMATSRDQLAIHALLTGAGLPTADLEAAQPFAPTAVQASAEFRSLCPQSATCMSKQL